MDTSKEHIKKLPLKVRGDHYIECPYCGRVFGNGISVVYSNIVRGCGCPGMRIETLMTKIIKNLEQR